MGWLIGRAEAMNNPAHARRRIAEKLQALGDIDDPEAAIFPIIVDAILLVEGYRGARHPMPLVDELGKSVDGLLRELTIVEKANEFAGS